MDAVEEVKSRLSVEDVVSEYVELKRAGRNLKGLSPFSSEKTPSFMVSPEKQIWHDFSSGKGGDMFTFVMEMEGLDFKATLELLARKAGVDLSQYRSGDGARGRQKERLYEANELAAKFYQVQFSRNQTALEYIFKKRQFTKETALAFRIGYAPNTGTALVDFLKSKGFTEQEIKQAGLATQRYRGLGDMFRGRIMIPLQDPQGRVIGFTARLLADDPDAPKYLNTPQTMLYDKGRHVYGLHLAKEAIRKAKFVVVVEGNLDVIASHQAGITNTVATAGTAMTEMHLKALGRFANDIRLAFDQDAAGLNAAERVIPLASKVEVSLSMITIPAGKDPDELVKKDPDAWRRVIDRNQYALDWLIDRYAAQLDLTGAAGKREFTDITLRVVNRLEDKVEQDHYMNKIADLTATSADAVRQKAANLQKGTTSPARILKKGARPPQVEPTAAEHIKTQNHLMALVLMVPNLRTYLEKLQTSMLPEQRAQDLFNFLQSHPDFDGKAKDMQKLPEVAEYAKILALLFEELYQDLEVTELRYEAARLQVRLIEQYVKTKKANLSAALQTADESQTAELLRHVKELDQLLKQAKSGDVDGR